MALPRPRAAALERRSRVPRADSRAHPPGCTPWGARSLALGKTAPRFHDVLRPPPDLVVNPANILAHYAQGQHLDAAEEHNDDHDCWVPYWERITRELQDEVRDCEKEGDKREGEPQKRNHLQWVPRESHDAVDPNHNRSEEAVVLARTGTPSFTVVKYAGLAKTN